MSVAARIREQAKQLTEDERLDLALELLDSMDESAPTREWEAVWVDECKRRLDGFDRASARSWQNVRADLAARLPK